MPSRYVTIKQDEPDFLNYLWGRNEKNNLRAIPVKTYNLGTAEELITFEIRDISEIEKPGLFVYISSLIKLKSFILILFPLFYVLSKNYLSNTFFDPIGIMLASVSSILLFAGMNIRNDVYDHISGFDRVNLDSNNKPIRLGWISPHRASRWSLILVSVSALLALPAALLHRELVGVVAAAAILFFMGRFSKNNSYKQQHLGEVVLILLIGPALASGYQVALGAGIDTEVLGFGALWGFAVFYLIQVNNFSHIMTSSQSGIKNTMTKLGFDLSQKFLILAWIFFIAVWFLFHSQYANPRFAALSTFLLLVFSLPLFMKIANIKSPMGSGLQIVRKVANKTFLLMVSLFLTENFLYLWEVLF